MSLPEIEKMAKLMVAVRAYAISSARASSLKNPADTHRYPCLAKWDAFVWYELLYDPELVDFLFSGTPEADKLIRHLQFWVEWYWQMEIEKGESQIHHPEGR